ncbi:MAG: site-2 protease family protein [Chitinophagales bacterium]
MKGALRIGQLSGIGVFIHWTFTFILLYVAYQVIEDGGDIWDILIGEAFLLLIYLCVVLHEMGHILAARKYGVDTLHIVLYPIGGVASLERIPEKPFEELIVAIAGPMVNVGIALGLSLYIFTSLDVPSLSNIDEMIRFSSTLNAFDEFIVGLAFVNLLLVGFNLIPAFPMDGGRVLRALLAMKINRVKATKIASTIGQAFAILFVIWGFLPVPIQPFTILIGLFIYMAAMGENKMVYSEATLSGFKVQDVMRTNFMSINSNCYLADAVKLLLTGSEDDFIVLEGNKPIGVLFRKNLMTAVKANQVTTIANITIREIPLLHPEQDILKVFQLMQQKRLHILPVVDETRQLIGVLDRRNLNDFISLQDVTKNR